MSLRPTAILLVVVVVLLAGCGGAGGPASQATESPSATGGTDTPVTPTATATATVAATQTPTESPTATPSPTPTPNPAAQNPWDAPTVAVAVETSDGVETPARHERLLRASVQWANANSSAWADFPVEFTVVDEQFRADVVFEVQPTIRECGDETTDGSFGYCTPAYDADTSAPVTETVRVASRYATPQVQNNYRRVLAHLACVDFGETDRLAGVRTFEGSVYRDPWPATDRVVVGVDDDVRPERNVTGLVRDAVAYWESGAGAPHRNYTVEFVVRPNATDPDVTVAVVEDIVDCGTEPSAYTVGCAPVLNRHRLAPDDARIRVVAGYTDASTREILRHEFGHLHGRLHGQAPMPTMNTTSDHVRLPQPNATERRNAWAFSNLDVYVGRSNLTDLERDDFQREALAALSWVADGAGGAVAADLQFEVVDERADADIVIEQSNGDLGDSASMSDWFGEDVDTDESLELVSSQRIVIADDVDTRNVGYHVAYWLVSPFFEDAADHPDPIDLEDDDREDFPE